MSTNHKKLRSESPVGAAKRGARRVVKKARTSTGSAVAVVAKRLPSRRRVVKRANAVLNGLPSRTKRLVRSTPARILLGASVLAFGFVLARLKHLV